MLELSVLVHHESLTSIIQKKKEISFTWVNYKNVDMHIIHTNIISSHAFSGHYNSVNLTDWALCSYILYYTLTHSGSATNKMGT